MARNEVLGKETEHEVVDLHIDHDVVTIPNRAIGTSEETLVPIQVFEIEGGSDRGRRRRRFLSLQNLNHHLCGQECCDILRMGNESQ
jgi:hypothetical protein